MRRHTGVSFTRPVKKPISAYHNLKTMVPISTYVPILMPSYTVPYIPNLKEIAPAIPEIRVTETLWIFFIFSLLHCTKQ